MIFGKDNFHTTRGGGRKWLNKRGLTLAENKKHEKKRFSLLHSSTFLHVNVGNISEYSRSDAVIEKSWPP